jgi:large subunit ribosomal protein L3
MQGLIGKKIGMTRVFNDAGRVIAVTVIKTGNIVEQVKTLGKDGYSSVQLGFDAVSEKKVNKPLLGHFKKNNSEPVKVLKEFRLDSSDEQLVPGNKVGVEVFEGVRFVDIAGTSKGRGHTGTIKKYNFQRGRKSHGNTNYRERGSSGANTYPARVFPGLKMSGHWGDEQVTAKKLEVVSIDKDAGLLFVKGAVPGRNQGIVYIKKNKTK